MNKIHRNNLLQRRRRKFGIRRRHDHLPNPVRLPQPGLVPPSRPLGQSPSLRRRPQKLPPHGAQPTQPRPGHHRPRPNRVHDRPEGARRLRHEDRLPRSLPEESRAGVSGRRDVLQGFGVVAG